MSNLPVNLTFIAPNTQLQNDFPARGTADQFEPKESSFSKTLEEAVQANQSKRRTYSQPPKQEKPLATEPRPRIETTAGKEQPEPKADAKEDVKPEDDSEGNLNQGADRKEVQTSQLDRKEADETESTGEKENEAKTGQAATVIDTLVLSLLASEVPVDSVSAQSTPVDGQSLGTVAGVTPVPEQVSSVLPGTALPSTVNGEQMPAAAIPADPAVKIPEAAVSAQQLVAGFAGNQNAANFNQTMISAEQQIEAAAQPAAVVQNLEDPADIKLQKVGLANQKGNAAVTPAAPDVSVKSSVEQGKASETNTESGVKPALNIAVSGNDSAEGRTDSGFKDQFQSFNGQDAKAQTDGQKAAPETNAGQTVPGDQTAQVTGKDGKPLPINMRLIQTQLSINSRTDKVRADLPVDFTAISHRQNASGGAEAAGTAPAHVNKEELFSQIVERAKVMVNNGHSEIEVSLKPDHLGKLQLKVSVENQVVTAKFVAESQQVKEIIETNLSQLRQNMHDTGIKVDQLLVTVGQQNNGGNFQEAAGNQGRFTNQNSSGSNGRLDFEEMENGTSSEKQASRDTLIDLIA